MRSISNTAKAELNLRAGGDCWLYIIELTAGSTVLRYTENTEAVVFGGNTYSPFNFQLTIPDDADDQPDGELVADHTNLVIYQAVVGQTIKPTLKVGLVLGNQPTVTELAGGTLAKFKCGDYTVDEDSNTIRIPITLDMLYDQRFPSHKFDRQHFPKLFIKNTGTGAA